jgi:hypothetical protein
MRPASRSSDIASPRRPAINADDDFIVDRHPVTNDAEFARSNAFHGDAGTEEMNAGSARIAANAAT